VLRVTPATDAQNQGLLQLMRERPELDFWREPSSRRTPVEVMVSRATLPATEAALERLGLTPTYLVDNVQDLLDQERSTRTPETRDFNFNGWNTYEQFMAELPRLAADCPEAFTCSVEDIGVSHEGRNMTVLKVETGQSEGRSLWVDSLIHAREWLAGATTMNIFNRLIREYDTDSEAAAIMDRYDTVYFLPVMNPDGYAYTHNPEGDRLWRKNRLDNPESACFGVDLNRNYDWVWGQVAGGSSGLACSDTYRGASAASEHEVQAVQNYAQGRVDAGEKFEAWLSFHTYGYYWLVPFGDCTDPDNAEDTLSVAFDTARAIEDVFGTDTWLDGNSCRVLYGTDGTTADWAQGALGTPYAYTPELRGPFFTPGEGAIEPSYQEIWAGLQTMFAAIEEKQ
jgi:hypothetical protein